MLRSELGYLHGYNSRVIHGGRVKLGIERLVPDKSNRAAVFGFRMIYRYAVEFPEASRISNNGQFTERIEGYSRNYNLLGFYLHTGGFKRVRRVYFDYGLSLGVINLQRYDNSSLDLQMIETDRLQFDGAIFNEGRFWWPFAFYLHFGVAYGLVR